MATLSIQGGGTLPGNVVTQDDTGNVTLAGIFKAKVVQSDGVVAGSFAVKNDDTAPTVGDAVIFPVLEDKNGDGINDVTGDPMPKDENGDGINDVTGKPIVDSDGKTVEVKTKAVSSTSKILVTPVGDTPVSWIISAVDEGKGFTISLDKETLKEVKFNWWIVESK